MEKDRQQKAFSIYVHKPHYEGNPEGVEDLEKDGNVYSAKKVEEMDKGKDGRGKEKSWQFEKAPQEQRNEEMPKENFFPYCIDDGQNDLERLIKGIID